MATLCRSLTNATCVPNSRLCSYYLDRENSNDHTSPATMIAQGSGSLDSKAGCLAGKKWIIDLASAQLERKKNYWFSPTVIFISKKHPICIHFNFFSKDMMKLFIICLDIISSLLRTTKYIWHIHQSGAEL